MDNNITYGKNGDILWIRLYKQHGRKIRFDERCGLAAFLSGSLLHIYEKQIT
jgi:hypothetical protein